jgi:hypothetical protein
MELVHHDTLESVGDWIDPSDPTCPPTIVSVTHLEWRSTHPLMYLTGIAKPVYNTRNIKTIELGARACSMVFVIDANSRKNMLIDRVMVNATSKKKKNGPGSRRRCAIK